jgi:hypothetical protein
MTLSCLTVMSACGANRPICQKTSRELRKGIGLWLVDLGMTLGMTDPDPHSSPCTTWSNLKGRWCAHMSVSPALLPCLPSAASVQESVLSLRL